MNWIIIKEIFPYFISAGGAVSWLFAYRERRAAAQLKEGNVFEIMQKAYKQFAQDTSLEIGQMKEEIKMLRSVVESYKQKCDNCPNSKS